MTATSPRAESETAQDELLEEFLVDARLQGLEDRTLGTYSSQLEYFLDWIDVEPHKVDKRVLKPFLAHLKEERTANDGTSGLSQSTINSYFSAMNSFYKFLRFEDYIQENPVPEFRDRYIDGTLLCSTLLMARSPAIMVYLW